MINVSPVVPRGRTDQAMKAAQSRLTPGRPGPHVADTRNSVINMV